MKLLATAAVLLWAATAWVYLQASSGHILDRERPFPHAAATAEDFAKEALTQAARTQFWLERRMDIAIVLSGLAFIATSATFIVILF